MHTRNLNRLTQTSARAHKRVNDHSETQRMKKEIHWKKILASVCRFHFICRWSQTKHSQWNGFFGCLFTAIFLGISFSHARVHRQILRVDSFRIPMKRLNFHYAISWTFACRSFFLSFYFVFLSFSSFQFERRCIECSSWLFLCSPFGTCSGYRLNLQAMITIVMDWIMKQFWYV